MSAEVKLFKKERTYKDKNGEEKRATNFYVRCGDELIPVEVSYFGKDDKPDKQYGPRRAILSAFADLLPDRESNGKGKSVSQRANVPDYDGDIPF